VSERWVVKDEIHDQVFTTDGRRVCGFYGGIKTEPGRSRAMLVAASPELLEACAESLERFEYDGWPLNPANTKAIQMLRAAIAKATTEPGKE
jgi:hypothetical protein